MLQTFQTIDAGIDVCASTVQISFLNLDKKKIGDLDEKESLVCREQWLAFLNNPDNEDAAGPLFGMLGALKETAEASEIGRLVITVPSLARQEIEKTMKAAAMLGFPTDKVRLISRGESIIHYVLHQKRELWINQVQVFDFDATGFYVRKFSVQGIRLPKTVRIEEKKIGDSSWFAMADSNPGRLDELVLAAVQDEMRRTVVSSVYLVGEVFEKQWMKKTLPFLCERRKVFMGQNLYAEGSCYSAMKLFGRESIHDYEYDCEGRTKIDIGISVVHNGRSIYMPLSTAGTYWYKASTEVECIFDRVDSVKFILIEPITKYSRNVFIEMKELPKRPNKTTRVRIEVACVGDREYLLTVTDLGFGELFPATGLKKCRRIYLAEEGFVEEEVCQD